MINNFIKTLLIFIISFIFSLFFFYILGYLYCDEVWIHGFSYNISKGMVIYKDFNAVPTPLYFFLDSIFIKTFGNYIIVSHIFDSLLFASIIVLLFKIIQYKSLILLPIFIFFFPAGYNLLCLFFLILIIYLIDKKKDTDILIALIVGLIFITKQNIGILLFIPCFWYSKDKLKTIIMFLIPFLILSIYFIWNEALYNFINHCFLGMIDFGQNNNHYELIIIILSMINILSLLSLNIKTKFKDKELFYILMFQLIIYPIFDMRHYICSLFPVIYLTIKNIKQKRIITLIYIFIYGLYISLIFEGKYDINLKNDISFLRNNGEIELLVEDVKEYVGNNNNFFFTDYYGYFIKLYYDIPISNFDLLLSGNVGYKGMKEKFKELDMLCDKEKCYFFTIEIKENDVLGKQYLDFYNYIRKNYQKVDKLYNFDIYTNKTYTNKKIYPNKESAFT